MSTCRCKVMLQMNGEVCMITLVGKEGCNAGSGTQSIVVSELSPWKEFRPVVLLVVAIDSEVLIQSLIILFSLSITFRMISRSEMKFHVQCSSKGLVKVGYEFCTTIGSDVAWDTMLGRSVEQRVVQVVEMRWYHELK